MLVGVNHKAVNPGRGEVDVLHGGAGRDRFVLGTADRAFYSDRRSSSAGTKDYALIRNFCLTEGDLIQLRGSADSYVLAASPGGLPRGTAIFLKSTVNELIGIVQGASGLSLNSSAFAYV